MGGGHVCWCRTPHTLPPKSGLSTDSARTQHGPRTDPAQLCLASLMPGSAWRLQSSPSAAALGPGTRCMNPCTSKIPGSETREGKQVSVWRCLEIASPMVPERGHPWTVRGAPASLGHFYGWCGGKTDTLSFTVPAGTLLPKEQVIHSGH